MSPRTSGCRPPHTHLCSQHPTLLRTSVERNRLGRSCPQTASFVPSLAHPRGFSILEVAVVVAIVGLAAVLAAPRLQKVVLDRQLATRLEGSRAVLKQAQSLSSKLNVPVVVEPVFGEDAELRVYADYWDEGTSSLGSDLRFTVGTADRVLLRWPLQGENKLPLHFWSPLDRDPGGAGAVVGFTENPQGEDEPPLIVFSPPSGRIQDRGQLSITLAGTRGGRVACRSLSVITLIGQTRVGPCAEEPEDLEEGDV